MQAWYFFCHFLGQRGMWKQPYSDTVVFEKCPFEQGSEILFYACPHYGSVISLNEWEFAVHFSIDSICWVLVLHNAGCTT